MVSKVDETIDVICIWIQKQLDTDINNNSNEVSDMVKALAELVSASANLDSEKTKVFNKELLKKGIEESLSNQDRLTPNSIARRLRSAQNDE